MKALKIDYVKMRGIVEWGWGGEITSRLKIPKNMWGKRMDGTIPLKIAELNQFCRILNDLGEGKYGNEWDEIGIDYFVTFEEIERDQIIMPEIRPRQKTK